MPDKSLSIINRPRFRTLALRIRFRLLCLALDEYRDPIQALRVMKALLRLKSSIQGSSALVKWASYRRKYYRNVNSASWPSPAFDSFVRHEMRQLVPSNRSTRHLQAVIFSITSRCPLNCAHCYEWDNLCAEETLGLDDLRAILGKIKEYGISNIQFSGGEPLCCFDDLVELIKQAREGTDLWILTSGWGLTLERAETLQGAGLNGVVVSLDHYLAEEHNRFRGNNQAWNEAMTAIHSSRTAGLATALSLCATRDFISFDNLRRYLYLARDLGVGIVRILEPRQVGHYKDDDIELDARHLQILDVFYQTYQNAPPASGLPILDYVGFYQRRIGCFGGGQRYLYVDSIGDVHACPFCQGRVGNAVTDDLDKCVQDLRAIGCHKYHPAGMDGSKPSTAVSKGRGGYNE